MGPQIIAVALKKSHENGMGPVHSRIILLEGMLHTRFNRFQKTYYIIGLDYTGSCGHLKRNFIIKQKDELI